MLLDQRDATERIECFCARRPLLALAGVDRRTKKGFVWIKSIKNGNIVVEVIVESGTVRIRCRECLRFYSVTMVPEKVKFFEVELIPEEGRKDFASQGH